MIKRSVTIDLYGQDGEQQYSGRCVGLLDDKEFNAIINRDDYPDLQRKLTTIRTVPISDIVTRKEIQDLRLAIVIDANQRTGVDKKGIFITEPIELISQYIAPDDLSLIGTDGSYIMVKETGGE